MSMSRVPWSTFARCRVCLAMVDIRPPIGGDGRHSTIDLSRAGIPGANLSPQSNSPADLIHAVVEMKPHNSNWGCPRIAQQMQIDGDVALGKAWERGNLT